MPKFKAVFVYLALSLLILNLSGCFSPRFIGTHPVKGSNVTAVSLTKKGDTFTSYSYVDIPCWKKPCSQFDHNAPTIDYFSRRIGNIQFNVVLSKTFQDITIKNEVSERIRRLYLFALEQLQANYVKTFGEFALPLAVEITIIGENEKITHIFEDVTENGAVLRYFAPIKEIDLTRYSNSSVSRLFNLTSTLAHEITHFADNYRWANNTFSRNKISNLEYRAAIFRLYYRIHLAIMVKKYFDVKVELELKPFHKVACNSNAEMKLSADDISSLYHLDEWEIGYELGTLKVIDIINTCHIDEENLGVAHKKMKNSDEFKKLKFGN